MTTSSVALVAQVLATQALHPQAVDNAYSSR